jgi:hypothetical protein
MKTKNLPVRNSINPSPLRRAFFLIPLLLVNFALLPMVQAVGPDTDGNIPGANNGEGVGVLVSRTTGIWNTGTGFEALNHLTAGNQNTATGLRALFSDINGGFNTATGVYSLYSNTAGFFNSATGAYSLAHNTDGNQNTANGYSALYFNTEGFTNTATGFAALYKNTTGFSNTANGVFALFNTTGDRNTATGVNALFSNTTGFHNTANGANALEINTTGGNNVALGASAGSQQTTGSNNVYIGANILGVAGESNACYIGSIFGQTSSGGTGVFINSAGKLGTATSSRRFKEDIKPMDKVSEAILALKPVTFRYKQEIDPAHSPQFGLVAEDVEKVAPDLVVRDAKGKVNTVRYEAVNAMLLNEFIKEHGKVEKLEATITELTSTVAQQRKDFEATTAQQQKEIQALTASVKEQASQIQKVSAQLEMSKPSPQVVLSNR